jgi:hypothetical protein
LANFVLGRIKPLMTADEILHLNLTIEVNVTESQV